MVSLSGEASFGDLDNLDRIRAYPGPLLLVGSEDDGYTPGDATRNLARSHPGAEQVIILSGSAHGLALLSDSEVSTAFDRFLARHPMMPYIGARTAKDVTAWWHVGCGCCCSCWLWWAAG